MAEAWVPRLRRHYLEEVGLRSVAVAQAAHWITNCNTARPPQALGYVPPTRHGEERAKIRPN